MNLLLFIYFVGKIHYQGPTHRSMVENGQGTQKWDVDLYQEQHNFVWEYGKDLISLLNAKPGEVILDLGCGSGELSHEISKSGANVVGMDLDPAMISKAREQFPSIEFHVADMRSFSFEKTFDAVFSNAALHWVSPDGIDNAMKMLSNSLATGGRLIAEFGGDGNVETIVQALSHETGKASPWYFPNVAEFSTKLEANGFGIVQANIFDRPTKLQGEEGLQTWLNMFGSHFFEDLTEEERFSVISRIADQVRPTLYKQDQWVADYRRIRVVAYKK